MMPVAEYLITHQISSGLSYGVFDTQYVYKRPESSATEGNVYFDLSDNNASAEDLLSQMDFPLVSVALSYDGSNPLDMAKLAPILEVVPIFGDVYEGLAARDTRDPETWKPTGPEQVLMRNATSTRREYEGQGIMANLARWLMREAKGKGFRGIQIETASDAVEHVWSKPPAPFKGEVVSFIDPTKYEKDDGNGNMIKPFSPSKQRTTKCYVTL